MKIIYSMKTSFWQIRKKIVLQNFNGMYMWYLVYIILCFFLGHLCLVPPGGAEQLCCSLSSVFSSGLTQCTSSGWVCPLYNTLYFIGVGVSLHNTLYFIRVGVSCIVHCTSLGWVCPLYNTLYFIRVGVSCIVHCTSLGWVCPLYSTLYFIRVGVSTV